MTADEKILRFIQDWHACTTGLSPAEASAFKLRQFARLMVRKGWTPEPRPDDATNPSRAILTP